MSSDDRPAFVIDTGSLMTKAGPGVGFTPSVSMPSVVARDGSCAGGPALGTPDPLWPVEHGHVSSWDAMETLWGSAFADAGFEASGCALVVAESSLAPKSAREFAAQLAFETFDVGSMYISMQGQLALFAGGATSGLAVEAGHGATHVVPVYEGFPRREGVLRVPLSGQTLDSVAAQWLSANSPCPTLPKPIIRAFKEAVALVAETPTPSSSGSSAGSGDSSSDASVPTGPSASFKLPDGSTVEVPYADRVAMGETLFDVSSAAGPLHGSVIAAVNAIDKEMAPHMYASIVLSGGVASTPGLAARLRHELQTWAPPSSPVSLTPLDSPANGVWHGGAILSTVGVFKKMSVTKIAYAEVGPNIMHRKCL